MKSLLKTMLALSTRDWFCFYIYFLRMGFAVAAREEVFWTLAPQMWSMHQQHQRHLKPCWKCRVSGAAPNTPFNKIDPSSRELGASNDFSTFVIVTPLSWPFQGPACEEGSRSDRERVKARIFSPTPLLYLFFCLSIMCSTWFCFL